MKQRIQSILVLVFYMKILKFTSSGWWHINAIRVDLTNEYAEIGGLFSSKGLSIEIV